MDLYYLHRINPNVPIEYVAEGMGRLIEEGLVRGWGLSMVTTYFIDRAHRGTPVSAIQNIGAGATILPCVTIGKYAIVGAASVVTHDVPDYAVVVGNPAKVTKMLDITKFE